MRVGYFVIMLSISVIAAVSMSQLDVISEMKGEFQKGRCRSCHPIIIKEQEKSMHARLGRSRDHVASLGDKYVALSVAEPVLLAQPDEPIPERHNVLDSGVNCLTCHLGPDGKMHGPKPGLPSPFHGIAVDDKFFSGTGVVCLRCHGSKLYPKMNLAGDYEKYTKETGMTCLTCHMPEVERSASVLSRRTTGRSHAMSPEKSGAKAFTISQDGDEFALLNSGTHPMPYSKSRRLLVRVSNGDKMIQERVITSDDPLQVGERVTFPIDQNLDIRVDVFLEDSTSPKEKKLLKLFSGSVSR